ncbi:de-hypoxanthine futalosine cyclase [Candidatus Methanoperedens nitroreducens]|uniref:Cyclic dehypoxanthine futalosine synthase n=1 Tax=Candidatus Methanoperedens nitratireducens TaxID=1392998 RepID=A0A062V055_9EURY|nr:cyclic dehypoxanthinyl futalosine synthase [Candidatus Methanoperedens nitroreducens]KCZ72521.1 de-hypoxanthine futalosine cyclase [Candidatus Methanoperedens nitroreducens]MDJ1423545.1 cyclic dehypoxanthinyl futalosine synthase [Candidatus Methanoperedens sp.]
MMNFDIIKRLTDDNELSEILYQAMGNEPMGIKEGTRLLESSNLNLLGAAADVLRKRSAGDLVTFVVDRNINYTNICSSKCRFCAFYREPDAEDAYVLTTKEILSKVDEAVRLGATQILLQGGLNPNIQVEYCEHLLTQVKKRFNVQMHAFSPPEIVHISKLYGASIRETILRLHDAGLDSIPGGGAEILDDRVRGYISPGKIGWEKWQEVMLSAHSLGIPTTATMVFGHAETLEERIKHIIRIRDMQKKYSGFTAFIPWSFQSENTQLSGNSTGMDYLKMVAVSRILLNGYIKNIQASWVTQGISVAQVALNYGANDLGGTMIEENVVRAAGVPFHSKSVDELVHAAKRLGRPVAKRDTLYNVIERY